MGMARVNLNQILARCSNGLPYERKPVSFKDRFSSNYFGTNKHFERQAAMFHSVNPLPSRYIDITAGGGAIPWFMNKKHGVAVTTNDIGVYSYCSATAALRLQYPDWDLHALLSTLDAVTPVVGKFSELNEWYSPDVAAFVDGLCSTPPAPREWFLAAVGRELMGNSFRGLFMTKTGPDKIPLNQLTVEDFAYKLLRQLWYYYDKGRRDSRNETFNMNASEFVDAYSGFENTFVWMDPAWPWKDGPNDPPYLLSSTVMTKILTQQEPPEFKWWPRDASVILGDILHWVSAPLAHGASIVITNTQDSNFPPPADVEAALRAKFGDIEVFSFDAQSGLAKKGTFGEFVYVMRG